MKPKTDIPLNTSVFTTKNVMKKNFLITRAYHDDDNSWQFFDDVSTNSNENVMVVGLGEILEHDTTIAEILKTPTGHYATRKSIADKWTVLKSEQEKE